MCSAVFYHRVLRKSIAAAPITYLRGRFSGQLPLRAWSNLENLRRSVKRPAVRVHWELEEYTLSHRYAERLPFEEGQPFSTAPTEPDSLAEPRDHQRGSSFGVMTKPRMPSEYEMLK